MFYIALRGAHMRMYNSQTSVATYDVSIRAARISPAYSFIVNNLTKDKKMKLAVLRLDPCYLLWSNHERTEGKASASFPHTVVRSVGINSTITQRHRRKHYVGYEREENLAPRPLPSFPRL